MQYQPMVTAATAVSHRLTAIAAVTHTHVTCDHEMTTDNK